MKAIHYTSKRTYAGRRHYIGGRDVEVVLRRLPTELWARLQAVYFNDRSRGVRALGYINRGRREIAARLTEELFDTRCE